MIAETVCSAVSAAGLGIAVVTAYRKRFLTAARLAAYSLVPIGLVMTGVVGWLADTALSPTAWAGFGVLGAAWLLFAGTRAVERRRAGADADRKAAGRAGRAERAGRDAVAPTASAPSLGGTARGTARPGARPSATPRAADAAEDFSDIEAILKKHGI
ncbi:hypothetical protein KBP30_32575 [Streptomyces sp. Go40/10]|uniref:hypothetical protein n=1 Tax=Streptomyces sp. Go40/10 TaxID=2825844 RepID=UPI001E4E4B77|nr:hypothetical protein [Streptomyces sp. Go40/10]UFR05612.1 hypothetical protein KBP30_32575 [Streptomyces sp. Go40/10]